MKYHVEVKTVNTVKRVTEWTRITLEPLALESANATADANFRAKGLARVVPA